MGQGAGVDPVVLGELVKFAVRSESSVEMVVVVLELLGSTLEDLVADDVRIYPSVEVWPPSAPEHKEMHRLGRFAPDAEVLDYSVLFNSAGDYGTACWPIDGNPAIQGDLFTVEE
jgi:hypothetical protein